MIHPRQINFQYTLNPRCPFSHYLDPGDTHCFNHFDSNGGYEVFCENIPSYASWLADIGSVDFGDIVPNSTPELILPEYIPTIPKGGGRQILQDSSLPFIAVSLGDIVSKKMHVFPISLRERFGIPIVTKVILLAYGKDNLIESIWPDRGKFYEQITRLGFDLVTGINYSVWHEQPHGERLINIKRSLVTFSEMQKRGIPSVPHMYWSGQRDLERWAEWLNENPQIGIVATDLQTERVHKAWELSIDELGKYFVPLLDHSVHFLVTGASATDRQDQLRSLFNDRVTITNKFVAIKSLSHQRLYLNNGLMSGRYERTNRASLFTTNLASFS